MIPTQIIITFLLTTLLFLWGQTIRAHQKSQDKRQKRTTTKELKPKDKQEARTMIGLEGVFTERKPRPTPEKVDATLQVNKRETL